MKRSPLEVPFMVAKLEEEDFKTKASPFGTCRNMNMSRKHGLDRRT
jgi:hypothetical protein